MSVVPDDNDLLNERLTDAEPEPQRVNRGNIADECARPSPPSYAPQNTDLCQWQVGPGGMFRPAAKTVASLEPGAYSCAADDFGPFLRELSMLSDDIIRLPESANIRVLDGITKFWNSRERYSAHGLVFKRGVLLWGPPSSGKTISCQLLARDLIGRGGIVILCAQPRLTLTLIQAVRRIEKERPLILVLEDIDEIIQEHGEHEILSMLDGEHQTDNICFVATTNYPERLGARIVNRPSRFDDRIFVGMPSEAARLAYLKKAVGTADWVPVTQWAAETKGLSIAHLRELVAAVLCLDQDYQDVLKRLRSMNERPKDVDGFLNRSAGFVNGAAQSAMRQ